MSVDEKVSGSAVPREQISLFWHHNSCIQYFPQLLSVELKRAICIIIQVLRITMHIMNINQMCENYPLCQLKLYIDRISERIFRYD